MTTTIHSELNHFSNNHLRLITPFYFLNTTLTVNLNSLKEDDEMKEKPVTPSGVHAAKMGPDDIQLHVHSDHGTGGHCCSKVIFFTLALALAFVVGLILLENRGSSDCKFMFKIDLFAVNACF